MLVPKREKGDSEKSNLSKLWDKCRLHTIKKFDKIDFDKRGSS